MYEVSCTQTEDKLEIFPSFFSRFRSLEVSDLVAGEQGSTSSNHLFYYYTQHTAQRSIIHISASSVSISLRSSSSMYEFIGILRYDDCFPLELWKHSALPIIVIRYKPGVSEDEYWKWKATAYAQLIHKV